MTAAPFPQLRVRTEFSFGKVFGPVATVAATLKGMDCPVAGCVDDGTWGHVRWAKALAKTDVRPIFGTELGVALGNGRKPTAWALGTELDAFYQFSTDARRPMEDLEALFAARQQGIIRFAGDALTDPECFDYVDLNPASPVRQSAAYSLHKRTGRPLVLTSFNAYPAPEHKNAFLACVDRQSVAPQHLLTLPELRRELAWLSDAEFDAAADNTRQAAARCASALDVAPLIKVDGDLTAMSRAGMRERLRLGHIAEWTPEYEARLVRELAMIAQKDYASYFIVVADLIKWAKERMLVGPARGSSAGSLVCYCLRITEVDPLHHDLLFERFIDITRNDLPDIDIDFNDQKREQIFVYLAEKYGPERVCRIGSINTLKPRSVMNRVCKKLGIPDHEKFDVLNVLIEYSSGDSRYGKGLEDTMAQTEPGKRFAQRYPEAKLMVELENHASHSGVHAAGVIVCNDPIANYCTVTAEGIAQIDKPDAEALNLLKIDALGLRTLGVIEDAGVVTADELYALKLDDPKVLDIFNQHRFAGIFQFEGQAQRRVAAEVHVASFEQIDHCTALARPGPLGGGASQHYIARAAGREEITYRHPSMEAYLSKTKGVVLYQEQVMRVCFEMGKFSWAVVSEIRKAMSGRKGKEYFDRRGDEFVAGAATLDIPEHDARVVWSEICTFGAWGMNASHTVSYGIISYWCAWMKCYHPLEYAAACMRNAKDDDQALEVLRDIVREGVEYSPFDIDLSREHWQAVDGKLMGGFQNLKGVGPSKARKAVLDRDAGRMTPAARAKLLELPVAFQELFPLRKNYADLYADPESNGCAPGSRVLTADVFPEAGEVLWLCKVTKKELRDENETVRVGRRNGKLVQGPSLFLDIFAADDSGIPITLRVDRHSFEPMGRVALENLLVGQDVLLVRGRRVPNFAMIKVTRMKCLTRPEALR